MRGRRVGLFLLQPGGNPAPVGGRDHIDDVLRLARRAAARRLLAGGVAGVDGVEVVGQCVEGEPAILYPADPICLEGACVAYPLVQDCPSDIYDCEGGICLGPPAD